MDDITTFDGLNFFLSNFWDSAIVVEGKKFSSVEHAYQAFKTTDPEWFSMIQNAKSAGQAKRLGGQAPLRKDWESVKVAVMEKCLRAKFQDSDLRARLLATGDAHLVEGTTWHDRFWGVCNCKQHGGEGQNQLGQLLMQLRREFLRTVTPLYP